MKNNPLLNDFLELGFQPGRPTSLEEVKSHFMEVERRLIDEFEFMQGRFLLQLLLTTTEKL